MYQAVAVEFPFVDAMTATEFFKLPKDEIQLIQPINIAQVANAGFTVWQDFLMVQTTPELCADECCLFSLGLVIWAQSLDYK